MHGFTDGPGIPWSNVPTDPLHVLLNHSDCDGDIAHEDCEPIARRLREVLPRIEDIDDGWTTEHWRLKAHQFAEGLMQAHAAGESVRFH
jgi:hypothetical protein